MITLKYWNSLSPKCREAIVRIISNGCDHDNEIILPYRHNFDYNITGKKLRCYLDRVFLTKTGKIKVFTEILPTFTPSDKAIKSVQKKQERKLHRYYFRIYTKSDPDDGETVWEEAYSESEARDMVYNDFHSITELDLMRVV